MALVRWRDAHEDMPTSTVDACEPALRLTSAVIVDGQADLLSHVDQISRWCLHEQRDAIRSARQLLADMERCRDLSDVCRVQHEWMFERLRRLSADAIALSQMMFRYWQRVTKWADEAAGAAVTPPSRSAGPWKARAAAH